MAQPERSIPYSALQARWTPYTNESTAALGTPVIINALIDYTSTPSGTVLNQPHSGGRGDTVTTAKGRDLAMSTSGVTPVVRAALFGHEIATTGTGATEETSLIASIDDVEPLGQMEFRVQDAANPNGDIIHKFHGCRAQNSATTGAGQQAIATTPITLAVSGHPTSLRVDEFIQRATGAVLTTSP